MGLEKLILDRQKLRSFNKAAEELRWLELGHISHPDVRGILNQGGYLPEEITPATFSHYEIDKKAGEVKEMLFDEPENWEHVEQGKYMKSEAVDRMMRLDKSGKPERIVDIGYGLKEIDSLSPRETGLLKRISILRPVPNLLLVDGVGKNKEKQLERLTDQIKRKIGVDYTLTREGDREGVWVREFLLNFDLKEDYVAQSLEIDGLVSGKYPLVDINPKLK